MELTTARHGAVALCNYLEPRLERLHGATIHLGVEAEQMCAGALDKVRRYRAVNER